MIRLLLKDFPKNHNLILVGQVELLSSLDLAVNQDIKSRVTYSVITQRLNDDAMRHFIDGHCSELGATVNPKNNLAHCFGCGKNANNIDLLLLCGHDFLPAVTILKGRLDQSRRDLGRIESTHSCSAQETHV